MKRILCLFFGLVLISSFAFARAKQGSTQFGDYSSASTSTYIDNTGNVLVADAVDGRGSDIANFGGGLPATDAHFAECGHVLQSKDAGTNVLVLCSLHFN